LEELVLLRLDDDVDDREVEVDERELLLPLAGELNRLRALRIELDAALPSELAPPVVLPAPLLSPLPDVPPGVVPEPAVPLLPLDVELPEDVLVEDDDRDWLEDPLLDEPPPPEPAPPPPPPRPTRPPRRPLIRGASRDAYRSGPVVPLSRSVRSSRPDLTAAVRTLRTAWLRASGALARAATYAAPPATIAAMTSQPVRDFIPLQRIMTIFPA
jgi:hypothetical protein